MIIRGLGTAVPAIAIGQPAASRLAGPLVEAEGKRVRVLEGLYARSGVARRHSVLLDDGDDGPTQRFFAPPADGARYGPATATRMRAYDLNATDLATRAAANAIHAAAVDAGEVKCLVTVSCTGFSAPGVDISLVHGLSLAADIGRINVGFMGCHGMFNGLDVARAVVGADPDAMVLVVAVELCTLHFRYGWESQSLVANALFADGAAAALCTGDRGEGLLRVGAAGRRIFPESLQAMTWRIGDHGFEMTLDPSVPGLIRQHAGPWIREWLAGQGQACGEIATWAVHPGGPRVLDAFAAGVGIEEDSLALSRGVLADYGNMSSATIGFILERVLSGGLDGPGVAVGFGPGLAGEAFRFDPL